MTNETQDFSIRATTGKAEPPGLHEGCFYEGCFSEYIQEETLLSKIQRNVGPAQDFDWEDGTAWFV